MIVKQEAAIDSYFTMKKHRGSEVRKYNSFARVTSVILVD